MEKIFIVMGTTGDYSDRTEWPVIAYFEEEKAKQHVINAGQKANKIFIEETKKYGRYFPQVPHNVNPFDPEMDMDHFTGTQYYYFSVFINKVKDI